MEEILRVCVTCKYEGKSIDPDYDRRMCGYDDYTYCHFYNECITWNRHSRIQKKSCPGWVSYKNLSALPEHGNRCVVCGTPIKDYFGEGMTPYPAAAYCESCDGYPCFCRNCNHPYIEKINPRMEAAHCPICRESAGGILYVQVKDGWD